jgi:hypothetical protein
MPPQRRCKWLTRIISSALEYAMRCSTTPDRIKDRDWRSIATQQEGQPSVVSRNCSRCAETYVLFMSTIRMVVFWAAYIIPMGMAVSLLAFAIVHSRHGKGDASRPAQ